jgi:hypothetical protein
MKANGKLLKNHISLLKKSEQPLTSISILNCTHINVKRTVKVLGLTYVNPSESIYTKKVFKKQCKFEIRLIKTI